VSTKPGQLQGWPGNAVAIADNGAGDKLVFLKEGRMYQPEVYVWLHDTGDLIEVAQSFSELQRAV
jgi:hypothetical protein